MNRFSKISVGLSAVALVVGGAACAQSPAQPSERDRTETRAEAQARAEAMFTRLDVNKDGKLDRADREARRQQMREAMFDRLDSNKDGSISKAEFMADRRPEGDRPEGGRPEGDMAPPPPGAEGAMPPPPPGGPEMGGPEMAGPDMGGPDMDRPGDRPERHGRHGRPGMKGPMMGFHNADGDRSVTQAEFVAAALQRFDRMDANKDGKVTPEERRAAHEKMRAEWKARKDDHRKARGSEKTAPPAKN